MSDTLEEFNRAYSEKEEWAREMGIYGFAEKLQRERDEAIAARKASAADWLLQVENADRRVSEAKKMAARAVQDAAALADKLSGLELRSTEELARLEQERNEEQAKLADIYRWVDKNHADGFIDSLTYLQNLEQVTDNWHDRLDIVERERDDAIRQLNNIRAIDIHTCHDQCKRPMCVLRRERDEARKDAKEIQKLRDNIQRIKEWLNLTDSGLRLRCGELTAQEIRTVRSVLKSIITNE